jgi:hypothetical protein
VAVPTERVFVAQPFPTAGARVIASPFQFWSTGEDNLRLVSVNALAGVALKLQGRFIDAAGTISASSWDHTPASDRTVRTSEDPLGVGAVLNLVVFATGATPKIGQTFVIVQLIRGRGTAAIVLGTLLQGYVTSTQALAWPGSPIQTSVEGFGYTRRITGTVPAPGAEVNETVPTGARWHVLMVEAQLTTSAAVAGRIPRLNWGAAAQTVGASATGITQNASQQGTYDWANGMLLTAAIQPGINVFGLPNDLTLETADFIGTVTTGIQAGDQWNYFRYTVREWLEVR